MTRFWLFLSSLSPGLLVASIRYAGEDLCLGLIGITLSLILTPVGLWTIKSRNTTTPIPTQVNTIKDETYQVPTYLITFIFPFLFIDIDNISTLIAYAVFMLFVAVVLFRSDISVVNPGLLIASYRLYDAQDIEGKSITIISKSKPRLNGYENLFYLSGNVYLIKTN